MKVIQQYLNKSITLPTDDSTGVTRIEALRALMVASSKALAALPKYELGAKYNKVPYLDIPSKDAVKFLIKGLDLEKGRFVSIADITDETKEDVVPDASEALDVAISGQNILKLEEELAKVLSALPQSGAGTMDADTAINTIAGLDSKILALPGKPLVFLSYANLWKIHNTMSSVQKDLLMDRLIPLHGLTDVDMVVVHTAGAAIGYELRDVETEREAGSGKDILVSSATFAFDVADGYHSRILLS